MRIWYITVKIPTILGAELTQVREDSGLTMQDVCDVVGWTPPTQCRLEQPGPHFLNPQTAAQLAELFKFDLEKHNSAMAQIEAMGFPLKQY